MPAAPAPAPRAGRGVELAEIFRAHGTAYRQTHTLSRARRRSRLGSRVPPAPRPVRSPRLPPGAGPPLRVEPATDRPGALCSHLELVHRPEPPSATHATGLES